MTPRGFRPPGGRRMACALLAVATYAVLAHTRAWAGATGASDVSDVNGAAAVAGPASAATGPVCVDAEVDGVRVLSYDCLTSRLMPSPQAAPPDGEPSASEQLATQPSSRVGTFNLSAERNRFGANFGKSVVPQRPAPMLPVLPGR